MYFCYALLHVNLQWRWSVLRLSGCTMWGSSVPPSHQMRREWKVCWWVHEWVHAWQWERSLSMVHTVTSVELQYVYVQLQVLHHPSGGVDSLYCNCQLLYMWYAKSNLETHKLCLLLELFTHLQMSYSASSIWTVWLRGACIYPLQEIQ